MGYHFEALIIPDSKHVLLFLIGMIEGVTWTSKYVAHRDYIDYLQSDQQGDTCY